MGVLTLTFRISEPMMFRGPGEFDPFVRGTYSRAGALAMPSPSTIAGTLSSYLISKLDKALPISNDWIKQYLEVLGDDIVIKGPLLSLSGRLMTEDRMLNGFISIEKVKEKCKRTYEILSEKPDSIEKLKGHLTKIDEFKKKFKPGIRIGKDVRVGIMLEQREKAKKTVKEGFIYGAEYLDYWRALRNSKRTSVEILADVKGKITEKLPLSVNTPVKFGGESRVALLSFQKGSMVIDEVKKRLWSNQEKHSGDLALYLTSSALFKGGRAIKEQVIKWAENEGYSFLGIMGESEPLGAGFNLRDNKRKPIYSSLKPGSIIFLRGSFNFTKLHWNRGLGEAFQIGYGSFIAVPL